jgi:hypothetical protein
VSKSKDRSGTVLSIEGELYADCVPVVEECCLQALAAGRPVCLFLRDVSMIDQAGENLLRRIAAKGVRLEASGVYMSHLVKTLMRAAAKCRP